MRIIFLLLISIIFTFTTVKAQDIQPKKTLAKDVSKPDVTNDTGYVNKGKITGKKAIRRSLIFPGLGQIYNYGLVVDDVKSGNYGDKRVFQKIYIVGKIGLIYGGGYLLVSSYIDNNNKYHQFLTELQYRRANKGEPNPNGGLAEYTNTDNLIVAKNIYKNNREVVLLSIAGLYLLNVVDAYVTARLKNHNVENDLTYKISPTIINTNQMYGFQPAPGLKLTLKL
jgi:hypothetical protein